MTTTDTQAHLQLLADRLSDLALDARKVAELRDMDMRLGCSEIVQRRLTVVADALFFLATPEPPNL